MPDDPLDYAVLRQLTQDPAASQRTLAKRFGVSVGKMNYCLRSLVAKGWVKANNFRRSDNKMAYAYILTPAGIEEKARLTRSFLNTKVAEYQQLQQEIESLRSEVEQSTPTPP